MQLSTRKKLYKFASSNEEIERITMEQEGRNNVNEYGERLIQGKRWIQYFRLYCVFGKVSPVLTVF
jgi:hypothetical protein